MLTATYEMLQKTYEGHYTVPAINTQGGIYNIIRTVCMVAEELRFPVILAHYANTGVYSGHDWFYEMARWMTDKVSVPAAIYLDHGDSSERCMEMLKPGLTFIMFDGSALPMGESAAATEAVVRVCRSSGVPLEAEIDELCHLGDRGNKIGASNIADPDMMRQYLELCHPGPLAIDIGNAHGFYGGPVDTRVEVLEEYRKLTDIPFVLHSHTGMDEELVEHSIDSGVAKTNFGTQVRCQYVNCLKEGLAEGEDQGHAWKLSQYAELRLCENIKDITRLAGSRGRT